MIRNNDYMMNKIAMATNDEQRFIDIKIDSDTDDDSSSSRHHDLNNNNLSNNNGHQHMINLMMMTSPTSTTTTNNGNCESTSNQHHHQNKKFLFNFSKSSSSNQRKTGGITPQQRPPPLKLLASSLSMPLPQHQRKEAYFAKASNLFYQKEDEDDDDDDEDLDDLDDDEEDDSCNLNDSNALNDTIQNVSSSSSGSGSNNSSDSKTATETTTEDRRRFSLPAKKSGSSGSHIKNRSKLLQHQHQIHSTPMTSSSSTRDSNSNTNNDTSMLDLSTSTKIMSNNNDDSSATAIDSTLMTTLDDDFNSSRLLSENDDAAATNMSTCLAEIGDSLNELNVTQTKLKPNDQSTKMFFKAYNTNKKLAATMFRNDSIVDGLLGDIYDRVNKTYYNKDDSEVFQSEFSISSSRFSGSDFDETTTTSCNHQKAKRSMKQLSVSELRALVDQLNTKVNQMSARLIRQLKLKDKLNSKINKNCDMLTAFLQARSLKRRVDTQMKFTLNPMPGEAGFIQWKDAMKALTRLPGGIPKEFRKSVWLNLAQHYIKEINLDWNKVRRIAFNDRSNPDDDELGIQIVKDLHRTGCSTFSGQENEQDRALLKRVLLAFARYNKSVGYCQGFNIIAALILEIVDKKEDDAFMCMIYLIDHILPEGYFTNSMHLLAIDMAVFREILKSKLPKLCDHLNALQYNLNAASAKVTPTPPSKLSNSTSSSSSSQVTYEPPLTNVFTMQWFLTLFATCLPKTALLRVWDCVFLEGSEILFRTSIAIWDKLSVSIMKANSADSFYSMMSVLTIRLFDQNVINDNDLINKIYSYGPFPFAGLAELREKYTFNIKPFQMYLQSSGSSENSSSKNKNKKSKKHDRGLSHLKLRSAGDNNNLSSSSSSSISSISSSMSPKTGKKTNNNHLIPNINDDDDDDDVDDYEKSRSKKLNEQQHEDLDLNNLRKCVGDSASASGASGKSNAAAAREEDEDDVEDLAKMISCFTLLMPARSINNSPANQSNQQQHNLSRSDIMMTAAAAASAYGQKGLLNSTKKLAAQFISGSSKQQQKSGSVRSSFDAAATSSSVSSKHDISAVTPGAFSFVAQMYNPKPLEDQLTLDLNELKKQYKKLKERQLQAHVIIRTASAQHRLKISSPESTSSTAASSSTSSSSPISISNQSTAKPIEKQQTAALSLKDPNFSPYMLEPSPIVNHLLIKPNDPQKNTVKTPIHIKTSAPSSLQLDGGSSSSNKDEATAVASRMNSVRASLSLNNESAAAAAATAFSQNKLKKKTSRPYYSDDDGDDDDDEDDEDILMQEENNNNNANDLLSLETAADPFNQQQQQQSKDVLGLTEQNNVGKPIGGGGFLNEFDPLSKSSSSSSSSTLSLSPLKQANRNSKQQEESSELINMNNLNEYFENTSNKKSIRTDSDDSSNVSSKIQQPPSSSGVKKTNKSSSSRNSLLSAKKSTSSSNGGGGSGESNNKHLVSSMIIENLANEEKRTQLPLHNPFKVKHLNSNVAKNGMRLGLYK